ncbi:flagellar protein [Paenibacillus hexagrammi]|uniref:Flagellar protein n=1 Tax=Paenibacillus hexagrammi TaxID=2908839 RepID=A0ABY3SCJ2_9BACL|nr:flagellar protein [Paenibacillus sp. YPD9-1]UJF31200.1 flagellar protein [Paenibacillus sp. YPD9-1]
MSIPQLKVANCPRCGKVYQKNLRNQCQDCSREMDMALSSSLQFLQKNYKATSEQVSIETGVQLQQVHTWMKEGKLLLSDYPNLSYPCELCTQPIRKHKMCVDCLTLLNKEIRALQEQEKPRSFRSVPVAAAGAFQIRDRMGRV